MSAQFNIRRASSRMVSVLQRELDLPRFVAATLVGRGIDTPKAARAFLFPSFKHEWLDPYLIPGLGDVVDALEDAVRKGHRILVFGDFDLLAKIEWNYNSRPSLGRKSSDTRYILGLGYKW